MESYCRFCLEIPAPNKFVHITWDDWPYSNINSIYENITKSTFPISALCSEICCCECIKTLNVTTKSLLLFEKVRAYWTDYVQRKCADSAPDGQSEMEIEFLDTKMAEIEMVKRIKPADEIEVLCFDEVIEEDGGTDADPIDSKDFIRLRMQPTAAGEDLSSENVDSTTIAKDLKMEQSADGKWRCRQCMFFTSDATLLEQHCLTEHSSYESKKGQSMQKSTDATETSVSNKCVPCNKIFKNRKKLNVHLRRHTPETGTTYQCDICSRLFWLKSQLSLHMKRHHTGGGDGDEKGTRKRSSSSRNNNCDKSEHCYLCSVRYTDITTIRRHYRAHHTAEELQSICLACNSGFSNAHELFEHKTPNGMVYKCQPCGIHLTCEKKHAQHMEAHKNRDYSCDICGKVLILKVSLSQHIRRVHMNERHKKCNICDESFFSTFQLNTHLRGHDEDVQRVQKTQRCYLCPVKYANIETIRRHYRSKHTVDEYQTVCLSCNTGFATVHQLQQHRKPDGNVYKCKPCGIVLACETANTNHTKAHEKREFVCDVCGKTFLLKSSLRDHLKRSHLKERTLSCAQCGKRFYARKRLNTHIAKHQNKINHAFVEPDKGQHCFVCPAKYTNLVTIRKHYRAKHTADEYETVCMSCNTGFATKEELREHQMPNGLPCKCKPCGIQLFCETSRQKHVESHATVSHVCDVCGKALMSQKSLTDHIKRVHFNERSVSCDICGDKFFSRNQLNRHYKIHFQ